MPLSQKSENFIIGSSGHNLPYSIFPGKRSMEHTFFLNHFTVPQLVAQITLANQRVLYFSTLLGQVWPHRHFPEYQEIIPDIIDQHEMWKAYRTALINRLNHLN